MKVVDVKNTRTEICGFVCWQRSLVLARADGGFELLASSLKLRPGAPRWERARTMRMWRLEMRHELAMLRASATMDAHPL